MLGVYLGKPVSNRVILSLILIALAIGGMLVVGGMIGGLISTFFLLVMLLVWTIPSNLSSTGQKRKGPGFKRLALAVLGIGLGLFASITTVLVLPPQLFPWVIMAAGIGLIAWFFISLR
jgi:hypothetical protein